MKISEVTTEYIMEAYPSMPSQLIELPELYLQWLSDLTELGLLDPVVILFQVVGLLFRNNLKWYHISLTNGPKKIELKIKLFYSQPQKIFELICYNRLDP